MRIKPLFLSLALALSGAVLADAARAACPPIGAPGGNGALVADMLRAELTLDERNLVEERFAPDYAEAARLGIAADALFRFARCDLNGAEPAELIAVGQTSAHCVGSGASASAPPVCGIWAMAQTPEGWVQVLEAVGRARLADSSTNGWRDLVLERGGAPMAMKFGGAVYQEDLGDADPQPAALEDFGGYGQGPGAIVWYGFDDPMPEALESAFLWFYETQIDGDQGRIGVLPDAFRIGAADLDDDGQDEAIIQAVSPDFCDPLGCEHWVLKGVDAADRPRRVAGRLHGYDVQAAASGGAGGRDLVAATGRGLVIYRNDGAGWQAPPPR